MKFNQYCFVLILLLLTLFFSISSYGEEPQRTPIQLSQTTHDACLKILRQAIKQATEPEDTKFWPAIHAAEALTLAGHGDEVRKVLEPLLKTEKNDQHRCGLARELVRAGDRSKVAIMLNILATNNSNGHIHACESLYKVNEIGDGELFLASLKQTKNIKQTVMAAAALARWGNRDAFAFLRKILQDKDGEIARLGAWVLGRIGDKQDIPAMQAALKRFNDPIVQAYFVNALALLGDIKAQKQLEINLSSKDAAIRTYAAVFAGEAGMTSVKEKLITLLDDPNLDTQIRAAQGLIVLAKPIIEDPAIGISNNVYNATKEHPRYSEGSVLPLLDGSLLYATTEFAKSGSDHAHAHIIGRRSLDGGRTWGQSRVLQKNIGKKNVMSVTLRYMADPTKAKRPIGMFYLVKNSLSDLKVYLRISHDNAQTFGKPIQVTANAGYQVMNNDRITILKNGRILAPVASTADVSKVNHFVSYCYISDDNGQHWHKGKGQVDYAKRGAMEPEVIELKNGNVLMIFRTQSGHIGSATSTDKGETWSKPTSWNVQAPEAPSTLRRIPSTGDLLLIWNDNFKKGAGHSGKRSPLTAAISTDDGKTWQFKKNIETNKDDTYSYISLTFHHGRAIMSYYVRDEKAKTISSRFRSIPIAWFYASKSDAISQSINKPNAVLALTPSKENPRNSEGDFIRLKNGQLMFVYSHFYGGAADHSQAKLTARFSDDHGKTWSKNEKVIVKNEGGFNVMSVSLLRLQNGKIALFYLRKNSLHDCRPMMRISTDEGKAWSEPTECIPDQIGYYVMNNDRVIQLKSGRLVLPFSKHHYETSTKTWDWNGQVMMYLSDDSGKTWRRNQKPLIGTDASGKRLYTQEPGVVQLKDGRVMLFVRSNAGSQLLAYSKDDGETFSKLLPSNIISPVSPASIERIPETGDLLMVWNNHKNIKPSLRGKRTPLSVAISKDDGKTWQKTKNLRDNPTGWFCYTAIHFEGKHILLGHCAGDRSKNNGLAETNITRLSLDWLYDR